MALAERSLCVCLVLLAAWILVSGLDDLFLDFVWLWDWVRRRLFAHGSVVPPPEAELDRVPRRHIAIFVPLWREHDVIGRMLEHNIAAIRYPDYEFFVGAYPNDEPTIVAVREAEARFHNIHLALCPHDGPTSKADCLNWVYQRMQLYEDRSGVRFEIVVLHDAEDLIHPEELRWLNYYSRDYEMVQIPVLPLITPFRRFTHGLYCDEFAEYQTKDLPARQILGGFIPSNGVGTGYARSALEMLASSDHGDIFDPSCLTEDYENGFRLQQLGSRQLFVPVRFLAGRPVATREHFPQRFRSALKQRTRWVMGIALQGWERHGWRAGWRQAYWFWRDRKGLIGNFATVLANAILACGVMTWLWSRAAGAVWLLARTTTHVPALWLLYATMPLPFVRLGVRFACVTRIYGWKFALGVPLRVFLGNWLNAMATMAALGRYGLARLRRQSLTWLKTDHIYPSRAALVRHKRLFGEILVSSGFVGQPDVQEALRSKPAHVRLGEHLMALGRLSEGRLWQTLSAQQNVPLAELHAPDVPVWTARTLPASFARKWKVLPFRIQEGRLYLAGTDLPSDEMQHELEGLTRLSMEFRYVTASNLEELTDKLLGGPYGGAKNRTGSSATTFHFFPRRSSRHVTS